MGVHDGHRERMRKLFLDNGLNSFSDVNVLEFLLFFAVPRKDTNILAHLLLDKFGSLNNVFDASESELSNIEGVGESTVALIKLIPALCSRIDASRTADITSITSTEQAKNFFYPRLRFEADEVFQIVCLDSLKRVKCFREIDRGVVNYVNIDVRKIAEIALGQKASALIIAHNHPDSKASPSNEDISCTKKIKEALAPIGITLVDHIIISRDSAFSFADANLI